MAGPYDTQNPRWRAGVSGAPAAGPIGIPAGQHGGFQDLRPAHEVIANPVPGYDYSSHPEFDRIKQGVPQKEGGPSGVGLGHPLLGMLVASAVGALQKPGVQGESPAMTASRNVGVPDAHAAPARPMNLPARGSAYPADRTFDIPAHWGQGYVESNGRRIYSYATPEEQRARDERDRAYRAQQWDGERHGMIRDLHASMRSLANGTGPTGHLPFEQRATMVQTLGQQLGGLMATDQHGHAAELEHGNDPRRNPDLIAAQVAGMRAEAQRHLAEAAAADPMRKVELLDAINKDPNRRSLAMGLGGADAATIAAMPPIPQPGVPGGPAIHAGNLDQHLGQQQNASMAKLFDEARTSDLDLGEVIARAANMPGFKEIASPTRQMFDAWLKQRYTDPRAWQRELYVPPNPDDEWPVLGRIGGLMSAIEGQMFGPDEMPGTGTGLGWRGNHDAARRRFDLIQKYSLSPF